MKKLCNYLSIAGLCLFLTFSLTFYYQIDVKLALFIGFIEIVGLVLCHSNQNKRLIYCLQAMVIMLSWFGFVANGLNATSNSIENQYKIVANVQYDNYLTNKSRLETQLTEAKKQLEAFPTLDNYIKSLNMPNWEDKTTVNTNYTNDKTKLQDNINKINEDLNKLVIPSKTIKVKTKSKGFNNMIILINKLTNIKEDNITILIYMIIGLVALTMIYLLKHLGKENVKTNYDVKRPFNINENVKTIGFKPLFTSSNVVTMSKENTEMSKDEMIVKPAVIQEDNNLLTVSKEDVKTQIGFKMSKEMLKENVKTSKENVKRNVKTNYNIEDVKRMLKEMYKQNDKVDVKMLKEKYKLTARGWQGLKKQLPELETIGTNTFYKEI